MVQSYVAQVVMATLALQAARSARALRRSLETAVVGQKALKEALVLGLVSREHLCKWHAAQTQRMAFKRCQSELGT